MWKLSVLVTLAAIVGGVVGVENIDIDIKVDSDSELYHQGKTAEGSFNYGYNVPRQNNNQFQHKVKGPDDVTYGCYGFVDPKNGAYLYHYVSDLKGYRVVQPYKPTTVYSARVANSVADIYDAVGTKYDWEKLYLPDVCRLLQKSKDERNDLSIPAGVIVNDDGSVSTRVETPPPPRPTTRAPPPPTTTRRPAPTTTTPRPTPRITTARPRASPPATPPPTTPRRTTPATRPPPPPPPRTTRPAVVTTTTRPATRPPTRVVAPQTNPPPPPTTTRRPVTPQTTTRRPVTPQTRRPTSRPPPPPPLVTRVPAPPPPVPRVTPKPNPQPPKNNGNKFGNNRDNFIGQESTNPQIAKPQPDLDAVSYEINELRTLVQNLLKQLNRNGPDCDDDGKSLGAVDPNAKHVFLPLVIVEQLPGAKAGAGPAGAGAGGVALPPGSKFAIPSVGYGVSRCNNCG